MTKQIECGCCTRIWTSMRDACICEMRDHQERVLKQLRNPEAGEELTAGLCNDGQRVKVYGKRVFPDYTFTIEITGFQGRALALVGEFQILADWLEERPNSWNLGYDLDDLLEHRFGITK